MGDIAGVEIERVDIGDTPGAVDHPVGGDDQVLAVMGVGDLKATIGPRYFVHRHTGFHGDSNPLGFRLQHLVRRDHQISAGDRQIAGL